MECCHCHPEKECIFYAIVGDLKSAISSESSYEIARRHLDDGT